MTETRLSRTLSVAMLFTASLVFCCTDGSAQTPFYQGKTITVVSGVAAGGSGDIRIRALLPFLRKHIPGNPTLIVENMAGAGGRKAA
jgi:tripartite-type tricarboxylate transporter receptor subunit TctC